MADVVKALALVVEIAAVGIQILIVPATEKDIGRPPAQKVPQGSHRT